MPRCPYCDKELEEGERYCYHCESDLSRVIDKEEQPRIRKPKLYYIKDDFKNLSKLIKKIFFNFKKRI